LLSGLLIINDTASAAFLLSFLAEVSLEFQYTYILVPSPLTLFVHSLFSVTLFGSFIYFIF
jgi:hypothetical protein